MLLINTAITTVLCFLSVSSAAPLIERQTGPLTDIDIAQFALTLEHLENRFYKNALSKWSVDSFTSDGFTTDFYDQLKFIAHDEETHVTTLESVISAAGATPVQACDYTFPDMDTPKDFVHFSSIVEGVGVSAYLGAAADITSKSILTSAGAILVTEALHQSAARNAVGEIPMANVFGTPMGVNAVYTIASQFITSCPSTNAALPVKAYPELTLISGLPTAPGVTIEVSTAAGITAGYGTFVSGISIVPVAISATKGNVLSVEVPQGISGQSYLFLTSDNSGNLTDSTILAGPAILEITPSSPTFNVSIS